LQVLYSTGCRVSEVCDMNIEDLDLVDGLIRVRGKGDKERVVLLTPTSPLFVESFLGANLVGAVPVPLASPMTFGGLGRYLANLAQIIDNIGHRDNVLALVRNHLSRQMLVKLTEAGLEQLRSLNPSYDISRFLRYNSYEGFALGAGVHTNDRLSQIITIGGYFRYGFTEAGVLPLPSRFHAHPRGIFSNIQIHFHSHPPIPKTNFGGR